MLQFIIFGTVGRRLARSLARLIHSCQLSVNFLAIRQSLRILPKIEYNAMDLIAFKYTSVL